MESTAVGGTSTHKPKQIRISHFFSDDKIREFIRERVWTQNRENKENKSRRMTKGQIALLRMLIDFRANNSFHHREKVEEYPSLSSVEMKSIMDDYTPFRDACFNIYNSYSFESHPMMKKVLSVKNEFNIWYREGLVAQIERELEFKRLQKNSPLALHIVEESETLIPGASDDNYTHSSGTYRRFHPLGRQKREALREQFVNCWDFDVNSCYPTIFVKELVVRGGFDIHPELALLLADKEAFYKKILAHEDIFSPHDIMINEKDGGSRRDLAKGAVQRLIHPPSSGKARRKTGCTWYDDLAQFIDAVYKAHDILPSEVHKTLSFYERELIIRATQIIGEDNFLLDRHDGFIAQISDDRVNEIIRELNKQTGYFWKANKFTREEPMTTTIAEDTTPLPTPASGLITPESLTQVSLHSHISSKLGSGDWEMGREAIIFCSQLVKGGLLPPITVGALIRQGLSKRDAQTFWNYCIGDKGAGKYWTKRGKELLLSLSDTL